MLSTKDVAIIYETLLSSPGMNDTVKLSLTIQRKSILLLTKVIEAGLGVKEENGQGGLLAAINNEVKEELKAVVSDLLKKAGLTEMNDKLSSLQTK